MVCGIWWVVIELEGDLERARGKNREMTMSAATTFKRKTKTSRDLP